MTRSLRSTLLTLGLLALGTSPAAAQADTLYRPSYTLPKGREIVAVYIGSDDCAPCRKPETKMAVKQMKPLLAAQAKQAGAAFSATIVSVDWELNKALEFANGVGAFDEYVLGGNWTNTGVRRYLIADSTASLAIPQVVLVERSTDYSSTITPGPDKVIRRLVGDVPIATWVRAGAPIAP